MKIAALYDIHGNLPALEAVLAELEGERPDLVVVGGDVVPGPIVRETLDRLKGLDHPTRFISGNGEAAALAVRHGGGKGMFPDAVRPVMEWTAAEISGTHAEELAGWPATVTAVSGARRFLFCHATPRDNNEIFTSLTPLEALEPVFKDVDADVVVCGHTHLQFRIHVGRVEVVNAGSVGMPFDAPGAYWLLVDGGEVRMRRTDYDLEAAAALIRETDYPQAEAFAGGNVLRPPARDVMEERLERGALGRDRGEGRDVEDRDSSGS